MAIIQISKIQQRSGNLVDLPQLDEAQFGFAQDASRLFIGKTTGNAENIEVLTAYSNITFSQIEGSYGNLNINIANANVAANSVGQVLAFDGNNWINAGANAGGTINLGDVANLKIGGAGGIGYILETDGLGNLSWTPKGTLYTKIIGLSNATPIVMTVANAVPYTNQQSITISGVNGASNTIVNGNQFYVKLASNYPVTGNVTLYSDALLTVPVNGTGLTYTNSPNAVATSIIGGGSGIGTPGGSNTCVQFNESGTFAGNAGFTFNNLTGLLAVPGNITATNASLGNAVTANFFIGNFYGTANLATFATTANGVAAANVTGLGNVALLNRDGSSSNILYGNGVFAAPVLGYDNSNVSTFLAAFGANSISTTGNISCGNITLANNSTISVGSSSNVGTLTGNWTLGSGSTLQATYADLAEYYVADQHYESGTVLAFGGDKEVTIAEDATTRVAGIVSTNPAYVLNTACEGEHTVVLALQGRVPCKVRGNIKKGDMLISAGNGFARPTLVPSIGTVIGKSLENFDGVEGIIEVAVGRL
jgi:hypothetical protein